MSSDSDVSSDSDESSLFFSGVLETEGGDEGIPAASDLFLGVKGGPEVILTKSNSTLYY